MIHQPEAKLRQCVIGAWALFKSAGFHISLTLPGAQENVPAPTLFNHSSGDIVVFVLIAVLDQLRAVFVPLKVSPYLIAAVLQIGVVGKIVSVILVVDGAYALYLGLDLIHDPDRIDIPDQSGLPVHRGQDAF